MSKNARKLLFRISRWIIAAVALSYACSLFPKIYEQLPKTEPGIVKTLLIFGSLFLVAILLAGKDLFDLVCRPFVALVDSFFLSKVNDDKPSVNYKLPDYYLKQERFEEARDEYLKIIQFHPHEARAYIGAFELAIVQFHDEATAKKIYRKARRKLRNHPKDLMWIESRWNRLASEWLIDM